MKTRIVVPALLLAAMFVTPASANWFSNPIQGVNRYIGSVPNPTPQDVRENRVPIVTENKDTGAATAQTASTEPSKPQDWWSFIRRMTSKEQTVAQSK